MSLFTAKEKKELILSLAISIAKGEAPTLDELHGFMYGYGHTAFSWRPTSGRKSGE